MVLLLVVFAFVNYFLKGGTRIVKSFTPPGGTAFYANPPTIIDDYLYIGTSINSSIDIKKDNYFYKMDLDFNTVWEYKLPDYWEVQGGGALDSRVNIYFLASNRGGKESSQEMKLTSLTNSGEFRWEKPVSVPGQTTHVTMTTPSIGEDDTIYVADSKLFAFNPDGTEKWHYPEDDTVFVNSRSSVVIDSSGDIYLAAPVPTNGEETDSIGLFKFTGNDGTLLWSAELVNLPTTLSGEEGNPVRVVVSTPAFTYDYSRIYAATGNTINGVNTRTGELSWSYTPEDIQGSFEASPAVDDKGNVYIGTKANEGSVLYAIKADGSGLLWKNEVASDLYCSPTLGDGDIIYAGSEYSPNGQFHAIDMNTGEFIWNISTYGIKDFQKTSPVIVDGYVYIGTMSKQVWGSLLKIKVDSEGYLEGAGWPGFHGGSANNGRRTD